VDDAILKPELLAPPFLIRFYFWKTEASRAIVLLVTFGVGMLAGWLSGLRRKRPLEFSEEHLSEKG
jgi:hypothetical protein